jgi:prevent-host-death family protein
MKQSTAGAKRVIPISEFKATCLAVLERVRRTGHAVLITRRGEPIAQVVPPPPGGQGTAWLGTMAGTATIVGDLIAPAAEPEEWEALGP